MATGGRRMDCRTARLLLDFARPRGPGRPPTDADALEAQLSGCADCDVLARAERAADERLAQAMRDVPVPDGLRDRIVARLQAERGDRHRRWLGWTVRGAAAAAAILLAVWLGFVWYRYRPRELDLWALHNEVSARYMSPSADKAVDWFKEDFNLKTVAPVNFNYRYLKDFG